MEWRWQKGRQTQSGIAFGKIVRYEVLTQAAAFTKPALTEPLLYARKSICHLSLLLTAALPCEDHSPHFADQETEVSVIEHRADCNASPALLPGRDTYWLASLFFSRCPAGTAWECHGSLCPRGLSSHKDRSLGINACGMSLQGPRGLSLLLAWGAPHCALFRDLPPALQFLGSPCK